MLKYSKFMEVNYGRYKKTLILLVVLLVLLVRISCQDGGQDKSVRFQVWAEVDAEPGLNEEYDRERQNAFAIGRIKKIAPYLVNACVYGFHVEYTPLDRTRGVEESFTISELQSIEKTGEVKRVRYKTPYVEENKLYCWVEYERTEEQRRQYKSWNNIKSVKVKGRGSEKISRGFEGIVTATNNAIKNSLRAYYRKVVRNKPKSIEVDLLFLGSPAIGIVSGEYVVTIDYFMNNAIINLYNQF